MYEANICANMLPLRYAFVWYPYQTKQKVQTLTENHGLYIVHVPVYSQAFSNKINILNAVLTGRC